MAYIRHFSNMFKEFNFNILIYALITATLIQCGLTVDTDEGTKIEFTLDEDLTKITAGAANEQEAAANLQQQLADAVTVDLSRIEILKLISGSTSTRVSFKIKPGSSSEPTSGDIATLLQQKLESGDLVLTSPDGKPLSLQPGSFMAGPAGGNCDFPLAWKQTTWFSHYDAQDNLWTANFTSGDEIAFTIPKQENPSVMDYDCDGYTKEDDAFYYVAKSSESVTLVCHKSVTKDHVIFQKSAVTTSTDAAKCKEVLKDDSAVVKADALVKHPLHIRDSRCPMSDGEYQMMVSENENKWWCEGMTSSYVRVDGSQVVINSCSTRSSSYFYPYKTTLYCVSYTRGSVIDSDDKGGVLILAYDYGSSKERYYCARYRIDGDNVHLSLNVFNEKKIECEIGSGYEVSKDTSSSKYRAFLLTPREERLFKASLVFTFKESLSTLFPDTPMDDLVKEIQKQIAKAADVHEDRVVDVVITQGEGSTVVSGDIMPGQPGEQTVPDAVNSLISGLQSVSPVFTTPTAKPLTYTPGSFNVTYFPLFGNRPSPNCAVSPCQNNGTCTTISEGKYACVCPEGYSGNRCERKTTQEILELYKYIAVVLIALAGVIMIVVLIALLLCFVARGKQEEELPLPQHEETDMTIPRQSITAWHSAYDAKLKIDATV